MHAGEEDHARSGWTTSRLPLEESIRITEDRDTGESRLRPWGGQPSDRGRRKNRTEQRRTVVSNYAGAVLWSRTSGGTKSFRSGLVSLTCVVRAFASCRLRPASQLSARPLMYTCPRHQTAHLGGPRCAPE